MNGEPVAQSNKSIIFLVVLTLAVNGTIGMGTLAYCLLWDVEPNTTLLTAFVGIVNYILGAISGMLVKTSPTETTKQPLPTPPNPPTPPLIPEAPIPVQVVNEPTDPVPTTEEAISQTKQTKGTV